MIYGFNDAKEKTDLLNYFYPVGSVYETTDSNFDPNNAWGGTWLKIENKVLVGCGNLFPNGSTGGHKITTYTPAGTVGGHALTVSEIPSHTHTASMPDGSTTLISAESGLELTVANPAASQNTGGTGGGQAHSHTFTGAQATLDNMPPYEAVNIWKRTA